MRAPFQILAILYKMDDCTKLYCVFHRSDFDHRQFIAGGGEDDETPPQAAKRSIWNVLSDLRKSKREAPVGFKQDCTV